MAPCPCWVGVLPIPRVRQTTAASWPGSTRCYCERRNGSPPRVTTTSAAPITNVTTPAAAGLTHASLVVVGGCWCRGAHPALRRSFVLG